MGERHALTPTATPVDIPTRQLARKGLAGVGGRFGRQSNPNASALEGAKPMTQSNDPNRYNVHAGTELPTIGEAYTYNAWTRTPVELRFDERGLAWIVYKPRTGARRKVSAIMWQRWTEANGPRRATPGLSGGYVPPRAPKPVKVPKAGLADGKRAGRVVAGTPEACARMLSRLTELSSFIDGEIKDIYQGDAS